MYNLLRAYACAREEEKEEKDGGKDRKKGRKMNMYMRPL